MFGRWITSSRLELRRPRTHLAWCLVVGLVSLWLRSGFPTIAFGFAEFDDALFVRAGEALTAGHWLGPYDNRTLVKGVGYPIFIDLVAHLGLSLKLAEHSVYLAVSALLGWFAAKASGRRRVGSALFTALAFNPIVWHSGLARVVREGLYLSLSPAVIALAVLVVFPAASRGAARSAGLGLLLGLVGAAFWLTREEGVWLVPAFASVFLVAVFDLARTWTVAPPAARRAKVVSVGASTLLAAAAFAVCLQAVVWKNHRAYGVAVLTEIRSEAFERAYGALSRIEPDHWRRFVVFPSDARERAYAASPAARELRPVLDGPIGARWRSDACDQVQAAPQDCTEILSGWFFWALRDAVTRAGHRTAPDAKAFYVRLASEIDAACAQGELACLPARSTLMPPFRWEYLADMLGPAVAISRYVSLARSQTDSYSSEGTDAQLAEFEDVAGPLSSSVFGRLAVSGWVGAIGAAPEIAINAALGERASVSLTLEKADDVAAMHPGIEAVRFSADARCPERRCLLRFWSQDQSEEAISLDDLKPGPMFDNGRIRLFIDAVSASGDHEITVHRRALQMKIARVVAAAYSWAAPALEALGVLGLVAVGVRLRRRTELGPLFALGLASLVAAICRVVLLAYLDVTSIPAVNPLYSSPGTPFAIIVSVTGIWLGLSTFTQRSRGARADVAGGDGGDGAGGASRSEP